MGQSFFFLMVFHLSKKLVLRILWPFRRFPRSSADSMGQRAPPNQKDHFLGSFAKQTCQSSPKRGPKTGAARKLCKIVENIWHFLTIFDDCFALCEKCREVSKIFLTIFDVAAFRRPPLRSAETSDSRVWGLSGKESGTEFASPFWLGNVVEKALEGAKRSQTRFRTPSPKVLEHQFVWIGLLELPYFWLWQWFPF